MNGYFPLEATRTSAQAAKYGELAAFIPQHIRGVYRRQRPTALPSLTAKCQHHCSSASMVSRSRMTWVGVAWRPPMDVCTPMSRRRTNTSTSTIGTHPKTVGTQRNPPLPKIEARGGLAAPRTSRLFHRGFEILKASKIVARQQVSGACESAKCLVFDAGPYDMSSPQTYRLTKSRPSSVTSYV
jgi:hypothetical protein